MKQINEITVEKYSRSKDFEEPEGFIEIYFSGKN